MVEEAMNSRGKCKRMIAFQAGTMALAAGFTLTAFAHLAQAQALAGKGCELLKDPDLRVKLSGSLERKLMIKCGEIDESALRAAEAQATVAGPVAEVPRRNDVRVSQLNDGTQSETTIARGGDGTLCAAWNDSGRSPSLNGFSSFGFSRNEGRTWLDGGPFLPGREPAPFFGPDRNFGDPSLAWSERDNAFYYGALSDAGLSLWGSVDGCRSFEYVGPIHFNFADDKELIAVDNKISSRYYGRIYVGWTNFSLTTDLNQTSSSDNGGLTWSAPVSLPGSGTNGQGMWPAIAPNSDVYFALLNQSFAVGGPQDQWIYKSTDGGNTWIKMTDIATGQLRPENVVASGVCGRQALNGFIRYLSSPQIAIHEDWNAPAGYVIHATYSYDSDPKGPDNSNVFYKRSTDGAATWSKEVRLNTDTTRTDQFFPALNVNAEGVVVASRYDRRLDRANNLAFDRFAVISKDGGLTWTKNVRVSDVSSPVAQLFPNFDFTVVDCYHGDYDQVSVGEERANIIWSDDRRISATGPNPDVYADRVSLH